MMTILRDAGLSELDRERRRSSGSPAAFNSPRARSGCPTARCSSRTSRPSERIGSTPTARCTCCASRPEPPTARPSARADRSSFASRTAGGVSRMSRATAQVEPLVETWSGARLNSPNDIVCRSDGLIYFTDPPYGVEPSRRALHFQGVFALDPRRDGPRMRFGCWPTISRSPTAWPSHPTSERSTSATRPATTSGRSTSKPSAALRVGSSRVFARLDPGQPGGPDGMKVDTAGRVYVAVALGVWVFEPDGRLLGILAVPARPSNLAWCDPDARGLAITAVDAVYHVRLRVAGHHAARSCPQT